MSSQPRIIQTDAVPPNIQKPFPAGSNNVYNAGIVSQNNQNKLQNTLAQNGGKMRKSRLRGGATPVIGVQPAPSYAVDKDATNANNIAIAKLANNAQSQAALDSTVNGNQADAALISAKQQALYSGRGGSSSKKRRSSSKSKIGGSWPVWGCLSGGKKSRKHRKNCKCKRRKSRKLFTRYRH